MGALIETAAGEVKVIGYFFTDIVSSMIKWERTPRAMKLAHAQHDALIEAIVSRHGGAIKDWAGDGIFATFNTGNPLQCALELQLALQQVDWSAVGGLSVRIGLHCSAAAPEGGVDQAAANRASRMMKSGWGGQIVMSSGAVGAYPLPAGCELSDLGVCRLKGIDEPLRLFGLVHPDLERKEFPPLRFASSYGSTAPAQTTPIHGRDKELAKIVAKLSGAARLVTVTGAGGNGKTRLAHEVAAAFSHTMPVHFVSLETAENAHEAITALAQTLRFPFHRGATPEEQLTEYLRDKQVLIVFDNADRQVGEGAWLARLVNACADLRILVTSREPLSIDGESAVQLLGLRSPASGDADFRDAPACALFTQAARAVTPGFAIRDDEFGAIYGICTVVRGSPLGLQLAAQWTQLLSLGEILAKLQGGTGFLSELGGDEIQRGLQRVVEGSWSLLTPEQQDALARLSLFRGGFSPEAGERVGEVPLAALGVLARKCLLEQAEHRRFVMHPLIHDYALARLVETPGGTSAAAQDKHARYFLEFVRDRLARARGAEQALMLDEVEREAANIRLAWLWAAARNDAAPLRATIEALFYMFVLRGLFTDCAALFSAPVKDAVLSRYFSALRANCFMQLGDYPAAEAAAQWALADGQSEAMIAAHAHQALGNVAHARGQWLSARDHYERALEQRAGEGDALGCYYSAISLAYVNFHLGDLVEARARVKQSFRLCQQSGHLGGTLVVHACAGDIAVREDRADDAQVSYRQALAVEELVNHPQLRAPLLVKLGAIAAGQGKIAQAETYFDEAREIASLIGDRRVAVNAMLGHARALRLHGDLAGAQTRLQRALEQSVALAAQPQVEEALIELARVALAAGELERARRIAGLLGALGNGAPSSQHQALLAELTPSLPTPLVDETLEEALLALVNEPAFGVLRL